jgi:tektin-1
MRKARYLLDRDLKDKFTAQSIDEHAIDLNLTSPSLYLKEGVTNIDPRYVSYNQFMCLSYGKIKC